MSILIDKVAPTVDFYPEIFNPSLTNQIHHYVGQALLPLSTISSIKIIDKLQNSFNPNISKIHQNISIFYMNLQLSQLYKSNVLSQPSILDELNNFKNYLRNLEVKKLSTPEQRLKVIQNNLFSNGNNISNALNEFIFIGSEYLLHSQPLCGVSKKVLTKQVENILFQESCKNTDRFKASIIFQ